MFNIVHNLVPRAGRQQQPAGPLHDLRPNPPHAIPDDNPRLNDNQRNEIVQAAVALVRIRGAELVGQTQPMHNAPGPQMHRVHIVDAEPDDIPNELPARPRVHDLRHRDDRPGRPVRFNTTARQVTVG